MKDFKWTMKIHAYQRQYFMLRRPGSGRNGDEKKKNEKKRKKRR